MWAGTYLVGEVSDNFATSIELGVGGRFGGDANNPWNTSASL